MARGSRGLFPLRLGLVMPERTGVAGAVEGVTAVILETGLPRLGTGLALREDTTDGEFCIMEPLCFICANATAMFASARGEPWALSGVSIDGFGVDDAIAAIATGV